MIEEEIVYLVLELELRRRMKEVRRRVLLDGNFTMDTIRQTRRILGIGGLASTSTSLVILRNTQYLVFRWY